MRARTNTPWSLKQEEIAKSMWLDGHSASQIAAALGTTRNAVIGKMNRLGMPKRLSPMAGNKPPKPTRANKARRALKAKQVSLPRLPINGPVDTADTRLLKSEVWNPLPVSVPKRMADLGPIGTKDRLGECRWPVGDDPILFCACASYGVYCPTHAAAAHKPKEVSP